MVDDELIETVALVHVRNERLLLVRPTGKGAFYLPGGKHEPGEDDRMALAREIAEELGTAIVESTLRECGQFTDQAYGRPNGTRVRMACYLGELNGEPTPSGEIAEFRYFNRAEYANMTETAPAVRQVMAELHGRGLIS